MKARERNGEAAPAPKRFGPLLCFVLSLLAAVVVLTYHSEVHEHSMWKSASKIAWKNASVRPPLLCVLVVGGWAWVVRVCRASSLNLELVLNGAVMPPSACYHAALVLLAILLSGRLIHLYVSAEWNGVTWRPWLSVNLTLHLIFIAIGLLPSATAFYGPSRHSLVRTLAESVVAPLAPVTFWHVIVADYLTSLAKMMADMQLTACISAHIFWPTLYANDMAGAPGAPAVGTGYVRTTELWDTYHQHCADTYANALMLALPFWWRLMQCLKVRARPRTPSCAPADPLLPRAAATRSVIRGPHLSARARAPSRCTR